MKRVFGVKKDKEPPPSVSDASDRVPSLSLSTHNNDGFRVFACFLFLLELFFFKFYFLIYVLGVFVCIYQIFLDMICGVVFVFVFETSLEIYYYNHAQDTKLSFLLKM
ncbi:hypothetical protein CsSME_00027929 [Camellia sinensis var. sinensis]